MNRSTFQTASASNSDEQSTDYSRDITDKQVQYILNRYCENVCYIGFGKSKFVLHYSLGMNKNNIDIQLNALHLHGVMGMTTKDIIDYFKQYDPKFLEWVSDSEC